MNSTEAHRFGFFYDCHTQPPPPRHPEVYAFLVSWIPVVTGMVRFETPLIYASQIPVVTGMVLTAINFF